MTKLLSFTSGEVQAFFGDIAPSTCGGSAYLCGNVGSLTVGLIDAWDVLYSWSSYRKEWVYLSKITSLLGNYTTIESLNNQGVSNMKLICNALNSPKTSQTPLFYEQDPTPCKLEESKPFAESVLKSILDYTAFQKNKKADIPYQFCKLYHCWTNLNG